MQDVVLCVLLAWAVTVAVIDWRLRKVPNVLLLLLLVPAIVVLGWRGQGVNGAAPMASVYGLAAGFMLTLPGYAASKLGAGDVKLAAVMGFVLGWPAVAWMLIASALVLFVMSIGGLMVMGFAKAKTARIPAAVALSGGFAVVLLTQRGGWL
ncbi:MAG: A24 family peptidase [Stagnimonas sp.]|nr:A24 family peptidase [Stagnimonas sp.]